MLAVDAATLRADAIACNGVIDGLWLEGCALPEAFVKNELAEIGLRSVGAILGVNLLVSSLSYSKSSTLVEVGVSTLICFLTTNG